MAPKRAVVFGGAGFLGSHVADELTRRHYAVTLVDLHESPHRSAGQRMVVGSVMDRALVDAVVQESDVVFHCAAIADIHEAGANPVRTVEQNIGGTLNVLEACRRSGVERVVFASTIYVYSDQGSFYRVSKQACELLIENYGREFGLRYTIVRYGSLYGARANDFNFIRSAIVQALTEGRIIRKGDGEEVREYINVVDAAKATVDDLSGDVESRHIIVTGHQGIAVKQLLAMINEMLGNAISIEYHMGAVKDHYRLTPYAFRPSPAVRVLPREVHDLGQGLLETIYAIDDELRSRGLRGDGSAR